MFINARTWMEKGLPTFSQGKTPCSKSALTPFSIAIMFYHDFFYNARTRAPNNADCPLYIGKNHTNCQQLPPRAINVKEYSSQLRDLGQTKKKILH